MIEVAVGLLVAWFARKAGRATKKLDGLTDEVIDASVERLHDLVMAKLRDDPSLAKLRSEVTANGDATDRVKERVRLALEDAAEEDPQFAAALEATVPAGSVNVAGNVTADHGGIAIGGVTGGSVSINHPHRPAQ